MTGKQKVRCFRRLWDKKAATLDEFASFDRHFDGGEWSDAFHSDIEFDEYQKTVRMVAEATDTDEREMFDLIQDQMYTDFQRELELGGVPF